MCIGNKYVINYIIAYNDMNCTNNSLVRNS